MEALKNSILATVAYYDSLDIALTPLEIFQFLINPKRWGESFERPPQLIDVINLCDEFVSVGRLTMCDGYYMFPGRQDLYKRRIEREKVSAQKWKKLLRFAWWFQAAPFLRGMFASGSLALEGAGEKSDFDVLVIAQAGRLYTCRLILSGLASLMGVRRTWRDKVAPDKFCFNHYITDLSLHIPHQSLFNAQTYANLKPVFVADGLQDRFCKENNWIGDYLAAGAFAPTTILRNVPKSKILNFFLRAGEFILNSWVGDVIEKAARKYQQDRIVKNPVTYESGGRTVWNDGELEFHPHSAEKNVLERYNRTVADFGTLWRYQELDSGLH